MPQTRTRLTHQAFLRRYTRLPPSLRQPFYDSLRFNEAAEYIDELEAENADLKRLVHLVSEFMIAQGNGDTEEMARLMPELGPLLNTLLAGSTSIDRTVAVSGEIVIARTADGQEVGRMESEITAHTASEFEPIVDTDEEEEKN